MNDVAYQILKEQQKITGSGEWIFIGPYDGKQIKGGTLDETLRRLVKNTKFDGVGFHVFRRSVASILVSNGTPERTIEKILGHQNGAMRDKYQHVFPEKMKEAMAKLGTTT